MKRILTYLFVVAFMFFTFTFNVNAETENITDDSYASAEVEGNGSEEHKEEVPVVEEQAPVAEPTRAQAPVEEVAPASDEQPAPVEAVVPTREQAPTTENTKAAEPTDLVDPTADVPNHDKTLTDNEDGTYTLSLTVEGETEKIVNKVNVIVILDVSGSMDDPTGNTITTYTPTDSTHGELYGLVNGDYVRLTRTGNGWSGYTFYYDNVQYTGQRYTRQLGNQSRLEAAQAAVNSLAESLLNNNGNGNPADTVEISLITFATNSTVKQAPTTDLEKFRNVVNGLSATGGTNWESALASVADVNFNDGDTTYVIFVSDGNPTFYSTNAGNNDYNGRYGVYGSGYEEEPNITRSYNAAVDDAQAIINNGMKFYTIGAYGNVDRMESLTTDAGAPADNYFSAANTAQLQEAFNTILQAIETAGFGDVTINDGTTSKVVTSSGVSHLLDVDATSFKYYKNDVEWTDAPEATLNSDGEVVWDLGDGLLENGVIYKVTFDVWPSQETLDLIADLKNNTISYDELDSEIQKYLVKNGDDYTLKTNTVASLSFTDTRPEGASGSTLYTNPEPVSTSATEMLAVTKKWNNDVDDRAESPVTLNILKDNTEWYSMTLDSNNGFKGSVNIAVGIMTVKDGEVTIKAPGHDFSFGELGSDVYNWELKTEVVHPMLINGELTMLIRKGTTEPTSGTYYKIGDYYYVVGELEDGVAKLTATNDRRSMIDITKTVEYADNTATFEDQLFNFEITVNDVKGEKVWFSIKESNSSDAAFITTEDGLVVTGATAEVKDGVATGYYFVESGSTFTVSMKAGWNLRIMNLLTGSTYTINEVNIDSKFKFDKVDYEKTTYVNADEEEVEYNPTIEATTVNGEVMSSNLVYSYEYINKNVLTEIVVTKVWDDNNDINGNRPNDIVLHLSNGTEDAVQPTKVENEDGSWTYTYTNLAVYDEEGNAITYTLTEDTVLGYTDGVVEGDQENGFTVTNTLELTSATVTKVWDDADNQDGKRPESLTVTLSDGTEVTLSDDNDWTATVENLPKYKNGEEVEYTWSEDSVEGYKLTGTVVEETETTLTNTHEVEKTSIEVTKVWDDESNKEGFRPSEITIKLLANGEEFATATLTGEGNEWTYTFEDLDVYADGEEIEYTIDEVEVENYKTTINGYTITNSRKVEKTLIDVSKVWDDEDNIEGFRPESITVELLANGKVVATATLTSEEGWAYTFEDLDVYADGEEIEYTIEEVEVENYKTTINGYTITNSREVERTSIEVTKVWDDEDNIEGFRPESITVKLLANGEEFATATLTGEGNEWTYTFEDLNVYENGEEIEYTIEEVEVENYETTVDGYTITNSRKVERIDVTVTKVWDDEDNVEGFRPSEITVKLLANGEEFATATLTGEGNEWTYTFEDLNVYENGEEIEYTIEEVEVENYETTVDGYTITNSRKVERIDVTVTKVWDDADNQDGKRPESLTVTLSDGTEVTLTEENNWTATVEGLLKYENGEEIEYTWEEETVEGYELTEVSVDGYTTTLTNTHEVELISIDVTKVWVDEDCEDDRPSSVTITLNADGNEYAVIELSEENDWMYTFTDLPKYNNGEEVEYTVVETEVENYVGIISGDAESGFVVTNYHEDKGGGEVPEEPIEEPTEILPPQTGIEETTHFDFLSVTMLLGLAFMGLSRSRKEINE